MCIITDMNLVKHTVEHRQQKIKIATSMSGNADRLLVFIHGLGCSRRGFDGVFTMPQLSDNYTILTLDLPGFGDSDKPQSFSYDLKEQADLVVQLIDSLGIRDIVVVGHSMGGVIGTFVAKQVDASLYINCEGNFVTEDAGFVSRRNAEQNEDSFIQEGFEQFVSQLEGSSDGAFRTWAGWCRQSSPLAFHRSAKSLVAWSDTGKLEGMYKSLKSKAYIHGDHGEITPIVSNFDSNEVFSIPHSGHFMMLDNPDEFYRVISGIVSDQ